MIIKKLNTVFHKHSRVLFGAFTLIIIVSFLGFLTPGQFGCGDMAWGTPAVGTAFGQKVTLEDLRRTERRFSVFSEAFSGRRAEYEMEQLFFFHCAELKAGQLGIHVGNREISEMISAMPMLQTDGKFDRKKYADLLTSLRRAGISEDELLESVRARIVIEKLQNQLFGNVVVTPSEVEAFYRSFNTKYQVAAASYTAKSVKATPSAEQLADFFKANRARYRVDGKCVAVLATVSKSAFNAEAKKNALPAALERFYRENTILYTDKSGKVKPFEEVRTDVAKRFIESEAAELARRKAYDFASGIYEEMSEVSASDRLGVFTAAAQKAGMRVLPECDASLNGDTLGKVKSRELVRALAQTADSNPVTDAVAVGDSVYVGCLISRTAPRAAEFSEVKTRVEEDWRDAEARRMASEAAVKINALNGVAARLKAFREIPNVKFTDFAFTKAGNPAPPAGFESALQMAGVADGTAWAVPTPDGSVLYLLVKRTLPAAGMSAAEKERCTMMCRALKQSVAAAEFSEELAANCKFTMKNE